MPGTLDCSLPREVNDPYFPFVHFTKHSSLRLQMLLPLRLLDPKPRNPRIWCAITLPHSPRSDHFFSQIKRTKISKEIIDHSDEEGLTPISESTAPRAEDLPPLPTETITFGNPADDTVSPFLTLVLVLVLKSSFLRTRLVPIPPLLFRWTSIPAHFPQRHS